jgi:hypothetical protein
MRSALDSANRPIKLGDKVRFRGHIYTIKEFRPGEGRLGTAALVFEEPVHTSEVPDEVSVDLASAGAVSITFHCI